MAAMQRLLFGRLGLREAVGQKMNARLIEFGCRLKAESLDTCIHQCGRGSAALMLLKKC